MSCYLVIETKEVAIVVPVDKPPEEFERVVRDRLGLPVDENIVSAGSCREPPKKSWP